MTVLSSTARSARRAKARPTAAVPGRRATSADGGAAAGPADLTRAAGELRGLQLRTPYGESLLQLWVRDLQLRMGAAYLRHGGDGGQPGRSFLLLHSPPLLLFSLWRIPAAVGGASPGGPGRPPALPRGLHPPGRLAVACSFNPQSEVIAAIVLKDSLHVLHGPAFNRSPR